jgi:hypothetical protein
MLLNDMRCHMRAFALLFLAAAASAQFECGMQLKDGDSITISQQYSAPQGRCTISGPATGSATITSTLADTQVRGTLRARARAYSAPVTSCLTDTQAIALDDEAGGEIVLSGNIDIVTRVTSAGYSPLCSGKTNNSEFSTLCPSPSHFCVICVQRHSQITHIFGL